jgi:recombination associated protein RdgC
MFPQITIFRLADAFALPSSTDIEAAIAPRRHLPIGLSQEKSLGFFPPRGNETDALVEAIGGHYILRLNIETKSVPRQAINTEVTKRCETIKSQTGRMPGEKERRDIGADVLLALLPAAFPKLAAVTIWIDPERRTLALNTASQGKCDDAISELVKAIPGLSIELIDTAISPQAAMTRWLLTTGADEFPEKFTVERECVLKSTGGDGATVKFNKHSLATEEVRKHVAEGKLPSQLALSWDGRVAFVLTDALRLKKIQFLDGVMDESGSDKSEDRFDADVALSTGLLAPLVDELIDALGGRIEIGGANDER